MFCFVTKKNSVSHKNTTTDHRSICHRESETSNFTLTLVKILQLTFVTKILQSVAKKCYHNIFFKFEPWSMLLSTPQIYVLLSGKRAFGTLPELETLIKNQQRSSVLDKTWKTVQERWKWRYHISATVWERYLEVAQDYIWRTSFPWALLSWTIKEDEN